MFRKVRTIKLLGYELDAHPIILIKQQLNTVDLTDDVNGWTLTVDASRRS